MRLLVVDDYPIIREHVRAILRDSREWTVVGEAESGEEAIQMAGELKPELILMDVCLPKKSGLSATEAILKRFPEIKVVIFTLQPLPELARKAMDCGARGFVFKPDATSDLIRALETVAAGGTFVSPAIERTGC